MKKLLAVTSLFFTVAALAELRPGLLVPEGRELPVVADMNRDGLTDLVHDDTVLINQGNAVFVSRSLGIGNDDVKAALDLNGDGYNDLVVQSRPGSTRYNPPPPRTFSVALSDGQMNFGASIAIPTRGEFFEPFTANVNDDGKDDLVLIGARFEGTKHIGYDVRILLSRGDGTFDERQTFRVPDSPQFERTHHVVTGDIDRDGHRDLLLRLPHELLVMRGVGDGNFATPETRYLPGLPFGFAGLSLADIDGDGNLDVVMAGDGRSLRVFFGDGRGRFPRHSSITMPQVRQVVVPPYFMNPEIWLDNGPRRLAIGEFVARGRTEIAAALWEGDVVFVAYEQGKLREVGRAATEFQAPDVYPGAFREAGKIDLYLTWNAGYGFDKPRPRVYEVEPTQVAAAHIPRTGRSRSVRAPSSSSFSLDVDAQGVPCMPQGTQVWTLAREGAFGVDRSADRLVETVIEDDVLYFRLTAPWTTAPMTGELPPVSPNRYEGVVQAETTCGYFPFVNMSAVVR